MTSLTDNCEMHSTPVRKSTPRTSKIIVFMTSYVVGEYVSQATGVLVDRLASVYGANDNWALHHMRRVNATTCLQLLCQIVRIISGYHSAMSPISVRLLTPDDIFTQRRIYPHKH